jgi:hypothetical protein
MKSALVVFPDEWVSYSPTVLNLISCLENEGYIVTVIAFNLEGFVDNSTVPNCELITISKLKARWLKQLGKYKDFKLKRLQEWLKTKVNTQFDLVFGIDSTGYIVAKQKFDHTIFLSLEILRDSYFERCLELGIDYLVIQTKERAEYLNLGEKCKIHYLPNAPIIENKKSSPSTFRGNLLYLGNIKNYYGIEECVDSTMLHPGFTLTIKGIKDDNYCNLLLKKYADVIEQKRLIFDFSYTEQSQIINSISNYDIGFSFYDMELIGKQDFNYISSPAGKVYNYFAAGLPVIGQNIVGMKCLEEHKAGILINERTVDNISMAIKTIENNYVSFSTNALKASLVFDFKKAFDSLMISLKQR